MAIPVLANLNFNGNQALGLRLEVLAADPSGGDLYTGRLWYNSTTNLAKYYDGTSVIEIGFDDVGVVTLTVDNVTLENIGTATNPNLRIKALGVTDAHIAAGAGIAISKLATNPLARANHTGTQTASTISDFDTQVRTSRLDQMAAPTADVSLNNRKLTNVTDPTAAQDAATKNYVDAVSAGLAPKDAVRAATTTNMTLVGPLTIDGVNVIAGDRVLVKAQTLAQQNGIYVVNAGAWPRAADADTEGELVGASVFVSEGTINGNTLWVMTTDAPIVVNTTALVWTQFGGPGSYTAGTGLTLTGTQFALTVPVTVALGGTGATTVAGAKTSLGFMTRFVANVGNGVNGSLVVNHNLGTRDVIVQVYNNTTFEIVLADMVVTDANNVTVTFNVAPTTNQFRVVVIG